MISIADAQLDMREAYYGGAPGVVSSGCAWLAAALVTLLVSPRAGILTLVVGGMFIFPVSVLLCKVIGCTGKHRKENPLAALAIESTIWMLLSIPIAIGASLYRIEWFFPAMLLVIAGRYLTFSTLYGNRTYWVFSGLLVAASIGLYFLGASVFLGALAGALVEFAFAIKIFIAHVPQRYEPGKSPR
ncbi:MAG: hypothetical protein V4751_13965 [Pseudomonadota bacterium]